MSIGTTIKQYDFVLQGITETKVAYLPPGSYTAFISSFEANMLNAQFGLMKNSTVNEGIIVPTNLAYREMEGDELSDMVTLSLKWKDDNYLYINKNLEDEANALFHIKII